ncbi:MAG: DUF4279 domain-containing protein [Solirubrobacteraceae bacterium]|nr:DUF4279 domain-containing protein [Solirubrobacteraceae bacterium]
MEAIPATPAATADLVEQIAAAQHSLVRSWFFDPQADRLDGPEAAEPPRLAPWLQPTADPGWLHRRRPLVDVANTWWEDLPADWRQRFRALASATADAVLGQTAEGRGAAELDADRVFVCATAATLDCDWLCVPRVHPLHGSTEVEGPAETLVRAAVRTYVGWLAGQRGLGSVPAFPAPDPATLIRMGGESPADRKHASFRLMGRRLDPDRMSELTGLRPRHAHRYGQLNVSRTTGVFHGPYRAGLWSVSTDGVVDEQLATLEDHVVWLLDRLEPHGHELRDMALADDLTADFFCGYFQQSWNSSWRLEARTLGRVAKLGASLGYDSYVDCGTDSTDGLASDASE